MSYLDNARRNTQKPLDWKHAVRFDTANAPSSRSPLSPNSCICRQGRRQHRVGVGIITRIEVRYAAMRGEELTEGSILQRATRFRRFTYIVCPFTSEYDAPSHPVLRLAFKKVRSWARKRGAGGGQIRLPSSSSSRNLS